MGNYVIKEMPTGMCNGKKMENNSELTNKVTKKVVSLHP